MVLHRTVERCIGGTAPAVGGGRASLRVDGHVRIPAWVEILSLCTVLRTLQAARPYEEVKLRTPLQPRTTRNAALNVALGHITALVFSESAM